MGDSSGVWTTAGGISVDWSLYAGLYTTWTFTGITVCSGGAFTTAVQLFDQTNIAQLAVYSDISTVPVTSVPQPLGAIPGPGIALYLAQVRIESTSAPPQPPQPSDRAVLLSSFLTLLP